MMSAYKLVLPPGCGPEGASQYNTINVGETQAISCAPENRPVTSPAEAAAIGGGILTLMAFAVLYAGRHGGAS